MERDAVQQAMRAHHEITLLFIWLASVSSFMLGLPGPWTLKALAVGGELLLMGCFVHYRGKTMKIAHAMDELFTADGHRAVSRIFKS